MNSHYLAPLIMLCLAIVQTAVNGRFHAADFPIYLPLLAAISFAFISGKPKDGAIWGFWAGISIDFYSLPPLGFSAFILTSSLFFILYWYQNFPYNRFFGPIIITTLTTVTYLSLFIFLLPIFTGLTVPSDSWNILPKAIVIHIISILPAYWTIEFSYRIFNPQISNF